MEIEELEKDALFVSTHIAEATVNLKNRRTFTAKIRLSGGCLVISLEDDESTYKVPLASIVRNIVDFRDDMARGKLEGELDRFTNPCEEDDTEGGM